MGEGGGVGVDGCGELQVVQNRCVYGVPEMEKIVEMLMENS